MLFWGERFLKGAISFLFSLIVGKFFKFIFIAVTLRLLTPNDFGMLTLSLSIIYIASEIASVGLPTAILKFISNKNIDRDAPIFSTIILTGVFTGVICNIVFYLSTTFFCVSFLHKPEMITPLQILSVNIIPTVLLNITRAVFQKKEKVKWIIMMDSINNLLAISIFLVTWFAFHSFYITLFSYAVSRFFSLIISLKYYLKPAGFIFSFANIVSLKPILHYAIPIILINICALFSAYAGHFMIGAFLTLEDVGKYGIVFSLSMVLVMLHTSFVLIFKPMAADANKNNNLEEVQSIYLFMSKWVSLCNGILLLIYAGFGTQILSIIGIASPDDKVKIALLILSSYTFFGTWVGASGSFLQMWNGEKLDLINMIVFFISIVLLNYWLTPSYGIIGAALAYFGAGFIKNLLQVIEMTFIFNFKPIGKEQLKIFFGIMFLVGLCVYAKDNFVYADSAVALFGIFITIIYTVYKLNEREKEIIKNVLHKKLKTLQ